MALLKCKQCGGDLTVTDGASVVECEYCGIKQTLPKVDDEQKAAQFNRGNHFRRNGEFDKALLIYENILRDDDTDAEAHWCCTLCRFGIEYVKDPATGENVPTCHRASFDSILEDVDYKEALKHSDGITHRQYEEDGAKIAEVQKGILATSQNEEPFDVFICYKESDESGSRTVDSTLAQDIYYQLTEAGMRVFFSRITLEDKVGKEYEPYIFAALHSAKVMLVIGTKAEYLNAVWVKNEWSRYLAIMRNDRKKLLIPCYRDMDPYDFPDQLSVLQSYDMSKIGFIQDLLRGVKKVVNSDKVKETQKETVVVTENNSNVTALLKRGNMALEDGEWNNANNFFEEVLNQNAECAEAYLGKLLSEMGISEREALLMSAINFEDNKNYQKAIRFAGDALKSELIGYSNAVKKRLEQERLEQERQLEQERLENKAKWAKRRRQIAHSKNMISTGAGHTVGLQSDGKVVAVGRNDKDLCDVSSWTDIIAVSAGAGHTVGLKSDGTVVATKYIAHYYYVQCDVSNWTNIVAVSVGNDEHTVGLESDGTVVAVGSNYYGQCDVSSWTDIIAVSAGAGHTVGLKSDGTVVAVGSNDYGQCDVSNWTDIVAVSAGAEHTVGLKTDGKVIAVGFNKYGQYYVSDWTNIVAISAGHFHTVGLKSDGTVVAVGDNGYGQCDVSNWKLFNNFETIEQEGKIERARAAEERREQLTQEKRQLQAQLPNLNGFFGGIKRKRAEARIAEIELELSKLP